MNEKDYRQAVKDVYDGTLEQEMLKTVQDAKDTFTQAATAFNTIRETMSGCYKNIIDLHRALTVTALAMRELRGFEIGKFIRGDQEVFDSDLSGDDKFVEFMAKLEGKTDPLRACKKLSEAHALLTESINSYYSKATKMRERLNLDGNGPEAKVATKKVAETEFVIDQLKKRRDVVFEKFHEAKRKIVGMLDECSTMMSTAVNADLIK